MAEAGIRELRDHLSRWVERVRAGEEVVVTDHGTAVARLVPLDQPRPFDRLVRDGLIELAPEHKGDRSVPEGPIESTISDLVSAQRR